MRRGTDLGSGRVNITAPGTESGTYDSFGEIVLEGIAEERGVEAASITRDPVPPYWIGAANDNNASGDPHGEGAVYLFTATEGVSDADPTTGASYTDPGYGSPTAMRWMRSRSPALIGNPSGTG